MSEAELIAEMADLGQSFDEGHQRFLHYMRAGRMAEARAVHEQMKATLDRQHEIQRRLYT